MKKRNSLVAIHLLLSTPAFAADLHTSKSIEAKSNQSIWEGFYLGLNGGIGGNEFSSSQLNARYFPGYIPFNIQTFTAIGSSNLSAQGGSGPSFGAQIGYNYIYDKHYLFGLESDINYSDIGFKSPNKLMSVGINSGQIYSNNSVSNLASKLDWFGTTRGRIGYAFGSLLPYITGGLAYGNISSSTYLNQISVLPPNGGYSSVVNAKTNNLSIAKTSLGWTAGAGAEYFILNNLSLKTEFLFMQLQGFGSNQKEFDLYNQNSGVTGNGIINSVGSTSPNNYYIARVGVNYFPAANKNDSNLLYINTNNSDEIIQPNSRKWHGLYIGANGSYATGNLYENRKGTLTNGGWFPGVNTYLSNVVNITGGPLTGLQAGYQIPLNEKILAGIETDFSWSGIRNSSNSQTTNLNVATRAIDLASVGNYSNRLEWLGTTRLRTGYNFGKIMPYLTAGFAYGLSTLKNEYENGAFSSSYGNHSFFQPGWVVGSGIDYMIMKNISTRFEYLYTNLGTYNAYSLKFIQNTGIPSISNSDTLYNQDFHQIRIGLNYHFNAGEEKVTAKY